MDNKSKIENDIKNADIDTLRTIVSARTNITITIATLAIAILVIASFNEKIIPVTPILKIWIVTILSIIPIILWDYNFELASGQNKIMKKYNQKIDNKNLLEDVIKSSSLIYTLIISIIIIGIIDMIVPNFCYTLIISIFDFFIIVLFYTYKIKNRNVS